ncbi:MAG: IPT/TIG domain-containing protein [Kofleriaceae bacterium]
MTIPALSSISPATGPASGGDVVRLRGTGFAQQIRVRFGEVDGTVLSLRSAGLEFFADVRTPPHDPAAVDISVQNLDPAGAPIPGEVATATAAYKFQRARIIEEANLTRVVRALLRALKRQVLDNVSASVSLDYDDTPSDGLRIISMAKLPSLVLSGPRLAENRFFSINQLREEAVTGPTGPELRRHRPPLTMDLHFTITGASDRTIELLSLMASTATFLNRNRWLELERDPITPSQGVVRWEMDPAGEFRSKLDGEGEVRVFTCGLVVRGVDVDEGLPMDFGKAVRSSELGVDPL